jgi:hypothetical protein
MMELFSERGGEVEDTSTAIRHLQCGGCFTQVRRETQGGIVAALAVTFADGLRWTPKIRPRVKMDFRRFAVDKKEQTYESKTQTAQCGLQG